MLDKFLNSKIRTKILSLFFLNKDKKFYVQQIIRLTKTDSANTHRELLKLSELSVLKNNKVGNQKYYFLNKDSSYYEGLEKLFNAYNQKYTGEQWFNMEEMPNYYPMIVANAWNIKDANKVFKSTGLKNKFSKLVVKYKNNMCALLAIKNEFDNLANEIINIFINNPDFGEKYNKLVRERVIILDKATEKLASKNLADLSDKQLTEIYSQYYKIYEQLHRLHWIQSCLDFGDNLFSKYLMRYLRKKIGKKKYSLGDLFSVLTTPTEEGSATKEYKDLLKILRYITRNNKLKNYFENTETRIIVKNLANINLKINKDLDDHVKNYGWIGYGTVGPCWGKDYFVDILSSLVRQNSKTELLLKNLIKDKRETIKKQNAFIKEFNIDKTHQRLFKVARDIVFTKGIRKDSMFYSYSVIENLYKEIGRRYYFSLRQVRYFYPHEIKNLLLKNKFNANSINERYKFSIHYSIRHYKNDRLLEGENAKKFLQTINIIKEDISNVKMLQGDCASPGRVRKKVSIINMPDDMKKMKKNNILISIATTPDLVPAIKQSSAIVTDLGGITCHAAIISRELGIPCVVGTKIATKVLKDGDLVDVQATHGKVTIIEKTK